MNTMSPKAKVQVVTQCNKLIHSTCPKLQFPSPSHDNLPWTKLSHELHLLKLHNHFSISNHRCTQKWTTQSPFISKNPGNHIWSRKSDPTTKFFVVISSHFGGSRPPCHPVGTSRELGYPVVSPGEVLRAWIVAGRFGGKNSTDCRRTS